MRKIEISKANNQGLRALACEMWRTVENAPYPWTIPPLGIVAQRLQNIVPEAASALGAGDAGAVNDLLRKKISPILRYEPERRLAVCSWILRDWGGIRANQDVTIEMYANGLGNGSPDDAEQFVSTRGEVTALGVAGISSWSKVLAFAHPELHAIYDSRTAVALNLIFRRLGDARRFGMPQTRNGHVGTKRRELLIEGTSEDWLGYREYLAILHAMVAAGAPSILKAEMGLFAAAPSLAAPLA